MEPWMWWVTFTIGLITALTTAVWRLAGWWREHTLKHTATDKNFTGIDKVLAEIKSEIKAFKEEFRTFMGAKPQVAMAAQVAMTDSPMRLNELGEKVSLCVDAKGIAKQVAPNVQELLSSHNPYDVQDRCKRYFTEDGDFQPSADQLDTFKQCAYEHGIKLEQVRYVCAIELRDELLRLIEAEQPARCE